MSQSEEENQSKKGNPFFGTVLGSFFGVLISLLVLYAVLFAWFYFQELRAVIINGSSVSTETKNSDVADVDKPIVDNDTVIDEGVTWLKTPVHIEPNPKLIIASATALKEEPELQETMNQLQDYFRVGSDQGKDIIVGCVSPEGPGTPECFTLLQRSHVQYDLITAHSSVSWVDGERLTFASSVVNNDKKRYAVLEKQERLSYQGTSLQAMADGYPPLYDLIENKSFDTNLPFGEDVQAIQTTPYGTLYEEKFNRLSETAGLVMSGYRLLRPNFTVVHYQLTPDFVTDDTVPQVTWNDGTKNIDTYRTDGGGSCGAAYGLAILSDADAHELTSVGKTNASETVYGFAKTDDLVVKAFYELYAVPWEGRTDTILTADDYLKHHALFVYKDKLNRAIVFMSDKYGLQAECGKPVIYLYPTQPTNVSVTVDATVTKSEPNYGGGWNVLAQPGGQLTAGGHSFDSLFWEGTGHGMYPSVRTGFVVAQADLKSTVVQHLTKLGLNDKERADFLDFWLPKLPKTPFVRLTWFGTQQMNELAPLTITPKPDTVIRLFLDFEGLQQPITLAPERLSSLPRKGFTVVEWGGLLRH